MNARENAPATLGNLPEIRERRLHRVVEWFRPRCTRKDAIVLLLCILTVIASQWWAGCYSGEFVGAGDEAAHFVTGLMVRDYLVSGLGRHPMRFAEEYYFHYPKVAIGYWPPMFYLLQGVWGAPFTDYRLAVMLLQALLTGLLGWSVYRFLIGWFDLSVSVAATVLLLMVPQVLNHSRLVMAEILAALLVFWAMAAYGRYLETTRWQAALAFGLFSLASLLTKGTGIVLALLPPVAVLLTRRWHLLSRFSFWLPALVVLLGAGPWYWLAPGATNTATVSMGGLGHAPHIRWIALVSIFSILGPMLCAFALTGLVERLVRIRQGRAPHGPWTAVIALLVSFLLIPSVIPVISVDRRYFIGAVAAMILLSAAGLAFLLDRIPVVWRKPALFVVCAGMFVSQIGQYRSRVPLGYVDVVRNLAARSELKDSVYMIVSDGIGEGAVVSEVAMNDRRPGHVVLRGSKVLGRGSWSGGRMQLVLRTPEQVMRYVESVPVEILITDRGIRRWFPTDAIIADVLQQYSDRWELIDSYPRPESSLAKRHIQVYRLKGVQGKPRSRIRIDMRNRIDRILEQ